MSNQFNDKEKAFFKKHQGDRFYLYGPLLGIFLIIFIGFLMETFNGFALLKQAKSIFHWILGLFLFGLLYGTAELGTEFINKKDSVSDPLYKRIYHLIFMLGFCVVFSFVGWLCYKYIWLKI